MTRVLVAAPVRDRAWILPTWLEAVAAQRQDGLEVDVACFYEPGDEGDDTFDLLRGFGATVLVDDRLRSPRTTADIAEHRWGEMAMYEHMASMRNRLAGYAERNRYDYLLSLDTDIILHGPTAEQPCDLERFLTGLPPDTAIGPLVNMDRRPYHVAWNYMNWVDDPDVPRDADGTSLWAARPAEDLCMASGRHQVDVVLAALLIPVRDRLPRWVAYPQGEDVGFPARAARAGLRFLVDTDVVVRHVMNRRVLQPAGT